MATKKKSSKKKEPVVEEAVEEAVVVEETTEEMETTEEEIVTVGTIGACKTVAELLKLRPKINDDSLMSLWEAKKALLS